MLLESVGDGRTKAKEIFRKKDEFDERMIRVVTQSARRIGREIDNLVRELEEVRLALQ